MKFKEGERIEVLRGNKRQSFSWLPGEIVSANGDDYTIRYQLFLNAEAEPVLEKVSQRSIRPQPPPVKEKDKWALGDIVEVFDLHCWKVGKVVKMLKNDRYLVRLCEQIQLKEFHESCLRVRQAWQKKKWIVVKKAAVHKKSNKKRNYDGHTQSECSLHFGDESSGKFQHPLQQTYLKRKHEGLGKLSPRIKTMKRNHDTDFQSHVNDDVGDEVGRMRRKTIDVERREQVRMNSLKQVDNVSSNKANVAKRCIIRSSEMDAQIERLNNHPSDPFAMAVQVTEVSNEFSVASCSDSNFLDCAVQSSWESCRDVSCSYSDDTESFLPTTSADNCELDYCVHELEVHAYRKTMQALYATGPLSWDQESLLTNLRLSLNISTDEHLLQLRQLLSLQIL
ncbi:hypothetical protein Sjap_006451 [Stephania japonica]|uniref:ENT domain-containing protein n=1 Tax=Stephania japonica TaxID=461633 RepID=A0AAP0K5U9_9MAGN